MSTPCRRARLAYLLHVTGFRVADRLAQAAPCVDLDRAEQDMTNRNSTAPDVLAACRGVIERSPVALACTEGEAHVHGYVNAAYCQLTETPAERLLGAAFADALPHVRHDGSLALLDHVWQTARTDTLGPAEHRRPGGDTAFWNYAVWPVPNAGRPLALIVHIQDATEQVVARELREQNARELRHLNERLLVAGLGEQELAEDAGAHAAQMVALLESMSDAVAVLDAEGRITLLNQAGKEIFGLEVGEQMEQPREGGRIRLRPPDGKPLAAGQGPITRALQGQRFTEEEFIMIRPERTPRRVVVSGSSIQDKAGRLSLALILVRDVTKLRELEQLKEQFVSLISHDLRTPLNAIVGYAELLSMGTAQDDPQKQVGLTEGIVRGARQMNSMIDELDESTRLEAGVMKLRKRPADLIALVSEAIEAIPSASARSRVRIDAEENLPQVRVDTGRARRVITNLVSNALKYSPPETPVTIRIEPRESEVVVAVTDLGPGIAPEDEPHLFERFFRAKTDNRVEGLGLGLYITRLIVDAHGGRIWVDTQTGKGSTFAFALPLE